MRVALVLALVLALAVAVLPPAGAATAPGLRAIPARYLALYRAAARTCPGLPWQVLAGIGTMESDNGRSNARGVHKGKNRKGAEGPMQFEPATFAEYAVRADPSGKLSPYNPKDAIFTAARMLCADGAAGGSPQGLRRAIFAYNHACWYVRDVLAIAARYKEAGQARHHRPHRHHLRAHRHHLRAHRHHKAPRHHMRPHRHRTPHRVRSRRVPVTGLCAGHPHSRGHGRKHRARTAQAPPAGRRPLRGHGTAVSAGRGGRQGHRDRAR